MNPLQRVVWSEGMLLSPQHFQQQDRYHEGLVDERVNAICPHAWGVLELDLDARALEAGQVSLRAFSGVLPGGNFFRCQPGDPELPPARAVTQHFPAHRETLDIYLALPVERSQGASYANTDADRSRTRYTLETRKVLDALAPSTEEPVTFSRRNLCLLFGEETREDYESLKLAELTRDASGKLCYAQSYVPPCLRLDAAPFLTQGVRRVLAAATAKRRAVAEELRHRDKVAVEFTADEVTRFLALHAISGAVPLLKHIDEHGAVLPFDAYRHLLQFAGQLTAFSVEEDPAQLPSYRHDDLRGVFAPLFEKLSALLGIAVSSRVVTIPLEARTDGAHLGRIDDRDLFRRGVRFLLSMQTPVDEQRAYELVPRVAKIASWREIPQLVNSAMSGVPLSASPRPPREVSTRPGKLHFALHTDHALWRGIVHQQAIAVHLPPPFEPRSTALELLAIPLE